MALTAFLTGVTEPIEFSFMFLAPLLYALHALMTGIAMVVMDLLGVKLGFTFSAGLLDYALNFPKATRPLLLLPVGAAYFALYYGVFRWAIARFDIKTPGREEEADVVPDADAPAGERGAAFVKALGGVANLAAIDACTTRLRLVVRDQASVSEAALRRLGAKGFVRPGPDALQVVLGPIADMVASEMRSAAGPLDGRVAPAAEVSASLPAIDATPWLAALGGRGNIEDVASNPSRLMLQLRDPSAIDEAALKELGLRFLLRQDDAMLHVLVDDAEPIGRALAA
jgi:N-acetylglucosamine PTS system EIICBA or EIICB component